MDSTSSDFDLHKSGRSNAATYLHNLYDLWNGCHMDRHDQDSQYCIKYDVGAYSGSASNCSGGDRVRYHSLAYANVDCREESAYKVKTLQSLYVSPLTHKSESHCTIVFLKRT